jgi:hypothetical protein
VVSGLPLGDKGNEPPEFLGQEVPGGCFLQEPVPYPRSVEDRWAEGRQSASSHDIDGVKQSCQSRRHDCQGLEGKNAIYLADAQDSDL